MNITKTQIDELNATIQLEISAADYMDKVENALKDYRRKANIPGFRKGMTPMGMIRKMYEKSAIVDEVNRVMQDSIFNFLESEKLEILGNPLPINETPIDWDTQRDFSFQFEVGMSPSFEVNLSEKDKVAYYKIVAADKMVDDYIADLRQRYGKMSQAEVSGTEDTLFGEWNEPNSEHGHPHNGSIVLSRLENKATVDKLTGLKVNDSVELNISEELKPMTLESIVGHEEVEAGVHGNLFTFTVNSIAHVEPAELNQEFFDRMFGEGKIADEADFRKNIKEVIESSFVADSDRKFLNDASDYLMNKLKLSLPDTFLKKWLTTTGEKPMSAEEVEKEYSRYAEGTKWQLIQNRLAEEHHIHIHREELEQYAEGYVRAQLSQYGQMNWTPEDISSMAKRMMKEETQVRRMSDELFMEKLISLFKDKMNVEQKEVSYEDFVALATK
jgi:trigger factor